jgi:hypothetical protein
MSYLNAISTLSEVIARVMYEQIGQVEYESVDFDAYGAAKQKDPNVNRFDYKVKRTRYLNQDEVLVAAMFAQTWASTALGFGGVGGAAITSAYSIVIEYENTYYVYFGGRFAYKLKDPNQKFWDDIRAQNLAHVRDAWEYTK